MTIERELDLHLTRRQFFGLTARGIGVAALGSLLGPDAGSRRIGAAGATRRRAACQACRTSRRRRSASSSCTSPAGRRSSRPSTTSRACEVPGDADPRLGAQGQRVAQTMGQSSLPVAQLAVHVRAARQVGHLGQRAAAAHREDRRRHHRHQDDEHGRDQPRSGDHVHPDRLSAARTAEHGRVAQLRAGQREPEPAGVRGPAVAGARDQRRSAAVLAAVGQRLPAVELSGRAISRRQRAGAVSRRSARHQQDRRARRCSTPSPSSTQ